MADWRSASMWAPPDWLQIYSVARLCRRAKFSKDLVLTLMSWVQLPANAPMDTSRHPLFFAHWCGNGDPCCDDMIVIRERRQSDAYLYIYLSFKHGRAIANKAFGHVAAECPW